MHLMVIVGAKLKIKDMIYLLYGGDRQKLIEKAGDTVTKLLSKKPNALSFKIDGENFGEAKIEEYIGGLGLFESKFIVTLNGVFSNKKTKEFLVSKVKEIQESQNIFIVVEEKLDKATYSKLEKLAEKTQTFDKKEDGRKFAFVDGGISSEEFNMFAFGDAFGKRDKKELWRLFVLSQIKDIPAEEVLTIISWQVRSILNALKSKDLKSSGLNPFVYRKAISFSKNFSEEELVSFSSELIKMYHEARIDGPELDSALEKFILSL